MPKLVGRSNLKLEVYDMTDILDIFFQLQRMGNPS